MQFFRDKRRSRSRSSRRSRSRSKPRSEHISRSRSRPRSKSKRRSGFDMAPPAGLLPNSAAAGFNAALTEPKEMELKLHPDMARPLTIVFSLSFYSIFFYNFLTV